MLNLQAVLILVFIISFHISFIFRIFSNKKQSININYSLRRLKFSVNINIKMLF